MTNNHGDTPVRILYFAHLSEKLSTREESLQLPQGVETLRNLQVHLAQRGGNWLAVQASTVRAAVNQDIAKADTPLKPGDEVAFFPPVTGG